MKLVIYDLDDTLFDTTGQLQGSYKNLEKITAFEGILKVLDRPNVINVLVTAGDFIIQHRKIDLLKIRGYFDSIYVCDNSLKKKEILKEIIAKYSQGASRTIVVGNRIDCEICYGNELGLTTIQMVHGKYKDLKPETSLQVPRHKILQIEEVAKLLD